MSTKNTTAPARDVVTELGSRATNGRPASAASVVDVVTVDDIPAPPAHPAPIAPVDFLGVHRKLERLLVSLAQTGAIPPDELHLIRAQP
jgi:hypothetical protein